MEINIGESRIVCTARYAPHSLVRLDTESERENGKRQVIFTGCWVARMQGVVRLYRGAEHTRAGGGTAALRQRGEGAARGAPHCCILRAPIFGRLRWKTWHLPPPCPRARFSTPRPECTAARIRPLCRHSLALIYCTNLLLRCKRALIKVTYWISSSIIYWTNKLRSGTTPETVCYKHSLKRVICILKHPFLTSIY